ncbi:MAG: hypothetical protein U0270_41295 [Labilithrix sp.]
MSYDVLVFGNLVFGPGGQDRWLACSTSPRSALEKRCVRDVIDELTASAKAPSFVRVSETARTWKLRGSFEKSEFATARARLKTLFMLAARAGARGQLGAVGAEDAPRGVGWVGEIHDGEFRFLAAALRECSILRKDPGCREIEKERRRASRRVVAEVTATITARAPLPAGVQALWSEVETWLRATDAELLHRRCREAEIHAFPKKGAVAHVADVFASAEELKAALLTGTSPRLDRLLSFDFYANALPVLACVDTREAQALARLLVADPDTPPELANAAARTLFFEATSAEAGALLDAAVARAPTAEARKNRLTPDLRQYLGSDLVRACARLPVADVDEQVLRRLHAAVGEPERISLDESHLGPAVVLAVIAIRRGLVPAEWLDRIEQSHPHPVFVSYVKQEWLGARRAHGGSLRE